MYSQGRIVIADDYEANLQGLRDLLANAHYIVRTATNGADALRIITEDPPDLVLLDVLMPGMSGVEVCAELKRNASTCLTPVVLISAAHDRETRLAGLKAGADDFLNKPVDSEELYTRVRSLVRVKRLTDELESAESLFLALGRIVEARDTYTEGHCERLAEYATALGRHLNLSETDLDALYSGAFLHDLGKIAIPDSILLKKKGLTAREYAIMKQHPVIGETLCRTVRSFDAVRPIIRHHHERLDGQGYPDGLVGEEIPLLARIVSVVDIFDALTTQRPYRRALSPDEAYKALLEDARRGGCDGRLVGAFTEIHSSGNVHGGTERERARSLAFATAIY
jgi:putative two-component system response regulator